MAAPWPISAAGTAPSAILLAQEYPNTTIVGFDYHQPSIDVARKRATEAGVADRVSFEVATAQDFPGERYDLVCIFDALHDMGDPPAAARHIRGKLDDDGTWLLVEPMAGETLEANVNPVGRIFYAGSTLHLHARRTGTSRRLRARQPGPRGPARRDHRRRRVHPVPTSDRDPVQPGVRSAALSDQFARALGAAGFVDIEAVGAEHARVAIAGRR